jgi:trans-aconitate 2-methyltransferase
VNWDAATYDRVAGPQETWARAMLERLPERVPRLLDAGCGTGRVTRLLLDRADHVVAVDRDPEMLAAARTALAGEAEVREADLLDLELDEPVDLVFSCAVFHWIDDHDRLFAGLRRALHPGGRLIAQCGGAGNIATVDRVAPRPDPFHFPGPEETEDRLRAAGFCEARAWLEPWPVVPDDPAAYVRAVCLHGHPDADALTPVVVAALGDPPEVDYVRLNLEATA